MRCRLFLMPTSIQLHGEVVEVIREYKVKSEYDCCNEVMNTTLKAQSFRLNFQSPIDWGLSSPFQLDFITFKG